MRILFLNINLSFILSYPGLIPMFSQITNSLAIIRQCCYHFTTSKILMKQKYHKLIIVISIVIIIDQFWSNKLLTKHAAIHFIKQFLEHKERVFWYLRICDVHALQNILFYFTRDMKNPFVQYIKIGYRRTCYFLLHILLLTKRVIDRT